MRSESGAITAVDVITGPASRLDMLRALEQKILWLAVWTIHHANHIRPKGDGLKVGGHQASSASLVTLMTALYFDVLRPSDRVAVKPHASPVFHAIQYLLGRQTREKLQRFRAFGGAQSYPSRTKDTDDVDFSTGPVGLGVAMTSFAALVQEYLRVKRMMDVDQPPGRMIALLGDAEFDEGNVFEAMLESWKHDVRDVWWIVDYNRQSLDTVVTDRLFQRMEAVFRDMEWNVITLKYGRLLEQAFLLRGGDALRDWIDACPNSQYSELAHAGGASWRSRLIQDLGDTSGIRELLDEHDDERLQRLMTNLGGHDLQSVLDAFRSADDGRLTCFIAYTIKGYQLPFQGHKDNHAGLMSPEQIAVFREKLRIREGEEWEPFAGLDIPAGELSSFITSVPFAQRGERQRAVAHIPVPPRFDLPVAGPRISTQEGFGRLLLNIARDHASLADHIVTTSPDVTVSTNLGSWVNRRGVFGELVPTIASNLRANSPQKWTVSPQGQHIELGIAENNLFILLAALGLSAELFGSRLLPIGTVYDPFICRGLDALNYACYQDARFILVATPSGLALAPEGGAHQSVSTPLIGIGQPSLTAFEPAHVDELCEILRWSFEHLQAEDGGSVYLRLSTRPLQQPSRLMTSELATAIIAGGYWLVEPSTDAEICLVVSGAVIEEARHAHEIIAADVPGAGLLVVTSADRLQRGWINAQRAPKPGTKCHVDDLLARAPRTAGLVTMLDGHSAALSWLGAVRHQRVVPLGVEKFGQSGSIPELYKAYGLDVDAIVERLPAYAWTLSPGDGMSIDVRLPQLGEATTPAKLGTWLKREGDAVIAGEPIAEVETDKTNVEIEAPASGILRILIAAGSDDVRVGARLGVIEAEAPPTFSGEKAPAAGSHGSADRGVAAPEMAESNRLAASDQMIHLVPALRQTSTPGVPDGSHGPAVDATLLAKKMAEAGGLDLAAIRPADGVRVTKRDVDLALGKKPGPPSRPPETMKPTRSGPFADYPVSSMRRVSAGRLALSKQTIPHFYLHVDCRVDTLVDVRTKWNVRASGSGTKVSVTDIVVFAVSRALQKVPAANAAWLDGSIRMFEHADIAVAVNTPAGLITPIVRRCEEKNLATISREISSLAERARAGSLQTDEYTGGTFTISNLGMFGVTSIVPIVNPPQACILGVGAIESRAIVEDGRIVAGQIMVCTLAADHRVIDGVAGAEFLAQVRRFLEDPLSLTLV